MKSATRRRGREQALGLCKKKDRREVYRTGPFAVALVQATF